MSGAVRKTRLAVVSPFVNKRHGTERRVTEWISQLAATYDIHIYSQNVQDLDLTKVTWHRIPKFPGPHLLNYLWWFAANRLWRAWDSRFRNLRPDIVYSPGINCLDADVMSVHIVFAQYVQGIQAGLKLSRIQSSPGLASFTAGCTTAWFARWSAASILRQEFRWC